MSSSLENGLGLANLVEHKGQNIPNSGSTYGKLIKSCFAGHDGYITLKYDCLDDDKVDDHDLDILTQIYLLAHNNIIKVRDKPKFYELQNQLKKDYSEAFDIHPGWFFFGIDFTALEDYVNTLLTKDPNKMKVFTDGYDSHCFRSYAYWKDQMPDIEDTVESINSIKHKYPEIRQKSKPVSFLLQYCGSYLGLIKNCGFNEYEARQLEANYHQLYKVSNAWLQQKLDQASIDGYVTLAFGLRLRTPILQKSVTNCHYMPTLARKEARTAGNALSGQSYCLLNSRAGAEFQMRVLGSKHWDAIKPSAHVHDCQYGLVKRDPEVIKWLNDNIVECVQWQELPEIAHNEIKLTGELEIFYPSWCNETKLMPLISEEEISGILGQVLNG